jgi:hypothetical protein
MRRIIGLALLVLAIIGTVNVVRKFSQGDTAQPTGNSAYDSGKKAGKYTAPVVLLVIGIFGLRLLLSSDGARPASPQRKPSSSTPAGDPSLRGAQNTFASNPALIDLNAGAWLAANPPVLIVASALAVAGLVLLFIKLVPGIVLVATAGIVLQRAFKEAKQKFRSGDVCPGVVLSAQQNLVAVFTDLRTSNLQRPAIKILKQPLNRFTTEPAYDGMRVAAAALYHGSRQQSAWQNFSPEVINCVVRDPDEIARVLGSISEPEWQTLDGWLAHIPVAKPGLYRMWEAVAADGSVQVEAAGDSSTPWFKTKPAIIGLSIFGVIVGLFVGLHVLGSVAGWMNHRNATSHRARPAPSSSSLNAPKPWEPTQTGPFVVGGKVEANWAGGWTPGKITSINGGGFSVMVQLEDSRWPTPIVLSTNQLRPK